jgi:cytoskeletal protein CcmA (bactofilin family)
MNMARKSHDDAFGAAGAETIIGSGVKVKGELNSESDIMIDGMLVFLQQFGVEMSR